MYINVSFYGLSMISCLHAPQIYVYFTWILLFQSTIHFGPPVLFICGLQTYIYYSTGVSFILRASLHLQSRWFIFTVTQQNSSPIGGLLPAMGLLLYDSIAHIL